MTWAVVSNLYEIHVVPEKDAKQHDLNRDCWCCPEVYEEGKDLIIHNSADRREQYEGLQ